MPTFTVRTLQLVRVFSLPTIESELLATIPQGHFVDILEIQPAWLLVQDKLHPHILGFVPWKTIQPKDDPPRVEFPFSETKLADTTTETLPAPTKDKQPPAIGNDATIAWTADTIPLEALNGTRLQEGVTYIQKVTAKIWNRYGGLLSFLANQYSIDPHILCAVIAVESGGRGFLDHGRIIIRFENHLFYRNWGKKNQTLFHNHFMFNQIKPWTGQKWRSSIEIDWQSFHDNQEKEWAIFTFAQALNSRAAKMSVSMGAPQILGSNYIRLGYPDVHSMFNQFNDPEEGDRAQIIGMMKYIENDPQRKGIPALQNKDYLAFAKMYNGSGQAPLYANLIAERVQVIKAIAG